jgi:hypothetical protein
MKNKLCILGALIMIGAVGIISTTNTQNEVNEVAQSQELKGWIKTYQLPPLGADTNSANQLPDPRVIRACTEVLYALDSPRTRSEIYLMDYQHVIDARRKPATFYVFGIKYGSYPTYVFLVENDSSKIVAKYVIPET